MLTKGEDSAELLRLRKIESRLVDMWQDADKELDTRWELIVCEDLRRVKRDCEKYLGYAPVSKHEKKEQSDVT